MAPSQKSNSSSKGKSVDRSTDWSDWQWDQNQGLSYSYRYNTAGEVEYRYPESTTQTHQHQADTPRSAGETPFSTAGSKNPASSARGSYSGQPSTYSRADSNDISASYQGFQTIPTTIDSYYTTSPSSSQATLTRGPAVSYSPSSSHSSTLYNPTSKSPYASSSRDYDGEGEVTTAFQGMSLNRSTSGVEQDKLQSPNIIRGPTDRKDCEKLDPRYRLIADKDQKKFWKVGRVFMMLWTEPAKTMGGTRNGTHYSTVWLEQGAYSEIRRFVVIKEGYGNSICSPIHTYNGQATLKPNLPERQQHAIIYTSQECPPEHWYTATDGSVVKENLTKDAIKVKREQKGPEGDLGDYSRLNYSKIYTVENYVRVLNIGIVERDWLPALNANSYVKPSETLGPVEKPTNHKPPRDSGRSSRESGGGHHKGKESGRRSRR